jgi:histidinol-phosphatase (PHP family)
LIEFGAFDILAHPDIIERNDALRGRATEAHYEAVATALADSATVPEINAGRIHSSYGEFHPNPSFLSILADHDVEITIGSDAHAPNELRERIPDLRDRVADTDLNVTTLDV